MASALHVYFGPRAFDAPIAVRTIRTSDCVAALKEGWDDFLATPTHAVFVGVFYAFAGIVLVALSSLDNVLQLVFPLAAGFAIVGPLFAVGVYEISRRREAGLNVTFRDAFAVFGSPALPSVIALGFFLLVLFGVWIGVAQALYNWLYGPEAPKAALPFLNDVLTTSRGWTLIGVGCLIGLCFAALALCVSVISFPLMLDRDVGVAPAVVASFRLARRNPVPVAFWGLIVAALLVVGSIPFFIGLAIVMPVLGHATWRLYRRAVVREPAQEAPIRNVTGEGLVETPGLREVWTFLDVLDFFRKGKV
jgi:uncharacterized membrane protein